VMRDWRAAKAWLYKELARGEAPASAGRTEPGNGA
jgi:hypothetical protein